MTDYFNGHDAVAKTIVQCVGKSIVLGVPLGLGKPIGVINALYRLACKDTSIQLTIITGLTLARPHSNNFLKKNFLDPLFDRLLKNYEDPLFEKARELQRLPHNIRVIEFFFNPGKYLNNAVAQQNYICSSYSTVARDAKHLSINVLAQQVAPSATQDNLYSLSSNTDLFHALKTHVLMNIAEVNANLPYMFGDEAEVKSSVFTDIVDTKKYPTLFPLLRRALSIQDYFIGLWTSCLIKDDSCLQIGIGNLSNALTRSLIFRHQENKQYQTVLQKINSDKKFNDTINEVGEKNIFEKGLYASTEMFSDEYMQLYKESILKKKIDGKVIQAAFFLGSVDFYRDLRALSREALQSIAMVSIERTNTLQQSFELLELQRRSGRFVNSSLMVTLLGAAISDGLENYQEVSGVGGQYDFVAMAAQLDDARSIINCHSTRKTKKGINSNIVWNYSNITIPRYLRDIIVTEYGIADCRGKTDADVIKAILNITDSRFQIALLKKAKKYGKISRDYEIPTLFRNNYPQNLEKIFREAQLDKYFVPYPFGSDLTPEEEILLQILAFLKNCSTIKLSLLMMRSLLLFKSDVKYEKYLIRMKLFHIKSITEYCYKKLLKYCLSRN